MTNNKINLPDELIEYLKNNNLFVVSSQKKLIFGLGITEARKKNMNIPFSQYGIISYLTLYFPVFLLIFKKKKDIKISSNQENPPKSIETVYCK